MKQEIWKDIADYEGLYRVSSHGSVYSVKSGIILKQTEVKNNRLKYKVVVLFRDGAYRRFLVHRLVAIAFIPNPENKPQVDHIDGNAHNNCVENLRWVTSKENHANPITLSRYSNAKKGVTYDCAYKEKMSEALKGKYTGNRHWLSKEIIQLDLSGNIIRVWPNACEVQRELGYSRGYLSNVCLGKFKSAYGYLWRYKQ